MPAQIPIKCIIATVLITITIRKCKFYNASCDTNALRYTPDDLT
jgi:hypothetical protein